MKITAETKVHDLLEAYPFLKTWLVGYTPAFEKLTNPVVYRTVGRVATLEAAARMGDVDVEELLDAVREQVAAQSILAEERSGAVPRLDDAERARRQEVLKGLIRELHDGASVAEVKARFEELVHDIDAAEIAMMEQALIAEGMPVEEVQRLCDVHMTVFKDTLEEEPEMAVAAGHPVDTYVRENEVLTGLVADARGLLVLLPEDADALRGVTAVLERLSDVAIHYRRKENQLFPVLESHGIEGPTKVMWALDDDIVAMVRQDLGAARAGDAAALGASLPETLTALDDMVYKEEKILFPTALSALSDEEWRRIAAGDAEIGYAWIEPPAPAPAPGEAARPVSAAPVSGGAHVPAGQAPVPLTTGALTPEEIDLMIGVLPVDISFVGPDDRVRFYSEGERIFPRSPEVIGREVRNCHPPKSVHKVEEILAAFKAGEKDTAEFWITLGGRFLHIRYFAMRDASGDYRGCLEVAQDVTEIRALGGERRSVDG
jgi:hypothetical protein